MGIHSEVGLCAVTLYVLQAVTVVVEDKACRVIEEHPYAVVAQLISWREWWGDLRKGSREQGNTGSWHWEGTLQPKKAKACNKSRDHKAIPGPPTQSGGNLPRPYLSE